MHVHAFTVAEGDRGALRNRCRAWRCMYTCPHFLIPPHLSHFLDAPPSLLPTQGGATAKVRMGESAAWGLGYGEFVHQAESFAALRKMREVQF